jgi:hypothetical protein
MSSDDHVHRAHISTLSDIKQTNNCSGWSTRLKGYDGTHVACFWPPDPAERENCIGAIIPLHIQHCFRSDKGERVVRFRVPDKQPVKLKELLREACRLAVAKHANLVIHARNLSELDRAVAVVQKRLPDYRRVRMEIINSGATGGWVA